MRGGVVGYSHNGEHRIETPIVNVNAAIHDKEIIYVMHLAVSVDHRGFRVVAHSASSSLMLPSAQAHPRGLLPSGDCSGLLEPSLGFGHEESCHFHRVRVV